MAKQTGQNVLVAYKVESTFNTAPGDTSGARLRLNSGGLSMNRPSIMAGELRADMLTGIGRMGSRTVNGSYSCDVSVGSHDAIWESVMRSTWGASNAITNSDMTSITTTTTTIVAAAGSWLTQGVRVGDIVRLTGHSTAANNDINLLVKTVVAATITLQGTAPLTADASADSAFTLTVLKKLAHSVAAPTRRSWYIEEYGQDMDLSEAFGGCRFDGFTLTGGPDGMATVEFPVVGASIETLASGASPYFTSPTLGTNKGLVFVDAKVFLGGTEITVSSGFSLTMALGMQTMPVIGASVTPDVFEGKCVMSGSLSVLRQDLAYIDALEAETEYELHVLLEEETGTPLKCLSFFLPLIKLTGADAPLGGDGGMIETLPFMVGAKPATTGYNASMMTICTED